MTTNEGSTVNEDMKGRSLRAAAALLDELGAPSGSPDALVTALAVAWLDGHNAGLADALSIVDDAA